MLLFGHDTTTGGGAGGRLLHHPWRRRGDWGAESDDELFGTRANDAATLQIMAQTGATKEEAELSAETMIIIRAPRRPLGP